MARWTDQGKRVVYGLVTSGEAGIDGMAPERAGPLREREQRASAEIVGVDEVEFLGLPAGVLEYGLPLRREITRLVRKHRPEVVVTNNFRDTWDGDVTLNQADHIATGRAVLDAVRDAGNRWVFTDLGLEPWGGVKQVWAAASPQSRHGVDVTATFDRGLRSLEAHAEYIAGLGAGAFDPEEFLEGFARATGTRIGAKYGASFEVFHFDQV